MKKIAIHQPNFLPWLGYFYKMKQCDVFIILDDVLVSDGKRNSYFTQTNLKSVSGRTLISLPQKKHPLNTLIKNVLFAENYSFFRKKFFKTLHMLYKKAPYFQQHYEAIDQIFKISFRCLYELNVELIRYCAKCLNIECQMIFASDLNSIQQKEARIIDLIKKLEGDVYISGNGAKNYQKEEDFDKNGIRLMYSDFKNQPYPQLYGKFISGLSVVDFLFNTNGKNF